MRSSVRSRLAPPDVRIAEDGVAIVLETSSAFRRAVEMRVVCHREKEMHPIIFDRTGTFD